MYSKNRDVLRSQRNENHQSEGQYPSGVSRFLMAPEDTNQYRSRLQIEPNFEGRNHYDIT